MSLVHAEKVAGEKSGFFTTGTGANFHHAACAVGIFTTDREVEKLVPQQLTLFAGRFQFF